MLCLRYFITFACSNSRCRGIWDEPAANVAAEDAAKERLPARTEFGTAARIGSSEGEHRLPHLRAHLQIPRHQEFCPCGITLKTFFKKRLMNLVLSYHNNLYALPMSRAILKAWTAG